MLEKDLGVGARAPRALRRCRTGLSCWRGNVAKQRVTRLGVIKARLKPCVGPQRITTDVIAVKLRRQRVARWLRCRPRLHCRWLGRGIEYSHVIHLRKIRAGGKRQEN